MSIKSINTIFELHSLKKSKRKNKNHILKQKFIDYEGGSLRWCDQLLYQQFKYHKELQMKASGQEIIIEKKLHNPKACDSDYYEYQVWKKEILDDEIKTQSILKTANIIAEVFIPYNINIAKQKASLAQKESKLWLEENNLIDYSKPVQVRYCDKTLHNDEELNNIQMMDGLGITKFKSGMIYKGEWKNGMQNGHGVSEDGYGNNYQGEYTHGLPNGNGKYLFSNGDIYDGEWKDNKRHGNGKYLYSNGNIYLGEWRNNYQHGKGKMIYSNGEINQGDFRNGKMHGRIHCTSVYKYSRVGYVEYNLMEGPHIYNNEQIFYYKKGELYNIDFNMKDYLIQNPYKNYSNYITIIINLHGSDKMNTNCKLINDDNHVRILSPVSCGRLNFIGSDIKNVFNTSFNVCNINKEASTYQKLEKILELINTNDMVHQINYDRHIFLPEIDHSYSLDNDSNKNNIFLVETNFNPLIGDRTFIDHKLYEEVNKEFTQLYKYDNIKHFDILPTILEIMNKKSSWTNWITKKVISHFDPKVFFYRSVLINSLLVLGYQTINILDFSCRNITASDYATLTGDYYKTNNKYVCESIKQPNHHIEREIYSKKF